MAVDFANRFHTAAMHFSAPKMMMVEDDVYPLLTVRLMAADWLGAIGLSVTNFSNL